MIIAAIGTARRTPTNPIIIQPKIIEINITTVFIPRVLLISSGIRTLFSTRLITVAIPATITHHHIPNHVKPAITAGMLPIIGPIYGIISNNHNIKANDNLFGILIPKSSKTQSDMYNVVAIYNESNNLDLSQIPSCL